jgi:hypothetical protein
MKRLLIAKKRTRGGRDDEVLEAGTFMAYIPTLAPFSSSIKP